jgi:NAD(P)-dependent dehydrogenase (short-subunit alcohol dehydrogenase family)
MKDLENGGVTGPAELCKKQFSMKFNDQKVVIAGGTSGIGLAAAHYFLQEGARVTVTGRNAGRLAAANEAGLKAQAVDSRDRKALDSFFAAHGPVDHLVIAASGAKGMGNFAELPLEQLREGFAEKFWAQLETVQAALPVLRGSITLITAISSIARLPGTSGLAAINGALELMVPVLARELAPVRINAVSPGVVDTPWWDFLPEEGKQAAFSQLTASVPARRVAKPEEVADVVGFLAGNAYVTGKVIGVDGGMA